MSAEAAAPAAAPRAMHPLLERLVGLCGAAVLEPGGFDAWAGEPDAPQRRALDALFADLVERTPQLPEHLRPH